MRKGALLLGLAVLLPGALGAAAWYAWSTGLVARVYVYEEENQEVRLQPSTLVQSVSWSAPREVPEGDRAPGSAPAAPHWQSPALQVYEARGEAEDLDIFVRELQTTGWTAGAPLVGAVNSSADEAGPCLSPDGALLFFASNRPGGLGGYDIYVSRRGKDGWEKATNLGGAVNSPYDETSPSLHPQGALLAFATARPRGFLEAPPASWDDVPVGSWKPAPSQIAYSARVVTPGAVGKWSAAQLLRGISSSFVDRDPAFAPGGDFLYFASSRPGGQGGFDLFRCRVRLARTGVDTPPTFEAESPTTLGEPVNSIHDELDPALLLGGHGLVFRVSDPTRSVAQSFECRTREVQPSMTIAALPFRALLDNSLRLGLLVGTGLLLVATIVLFFRRRHTWARNLLLRCSLVALLLHAVMLYGFYFWVVSDDIIALAEKSAAPREVTVERALEAKLSLEALRIEVAQLSTLAPAQAAPRSLQVPRSEPEAPSILEATRPDRPERALVSAAQAPEEHPVDSAQPALASVKELPPSPGAEATELPRSAAETPAPPPEDSTPAAEQSLKVGPSLPRPGPLATVEAGASSLERPSSSDLLLAATQVQAPAEQSSVLPPLARHNPEVAPLVTALAVPAQAPEASPAVSVAAENVAPRVATGRSSPEAAAEAQPVVRATEALAAESPWRTRPGGMLAAPSPEAEAHTFAEATLAAVQTFDPRPEQGAVVKLPEQAPVAEVASREGLEAGDPSPRPSARTRQPTAPTAGQLTATVAQVVSRPESRPRTAPGQALDAPTQASSAPLAESPRPGAMSGSDVARLERTTFRPESASLPEAEAGKRPEGAGAPEVADILTPRAATRGAISRPAAPAAPAPLPTAPGPPPTELAGPGKPRVEADLAPRLPTSSRVPVPELLPPAREAGPPTTLASAEKLPEAPPELRGEKDLRKVRSTEVRDMLVGKMGGTAASEGAVRVALDWLARHQSASGGWDVDHFDDRCKGCGGSAVAARCDAAVTALALLCFLGQNHTPLNPQSPYRKTAADAIRYLVRGQAPDGSLSGEDDNTSDANRRFGENNARPAGQTARGASPTERARKIMYSHGIATIALSEAYIMTRDPELEGPVRKAIDLILRSQNPRTGGWRYWPSPEAHGDTSISGWQVLALVSARGAGIDVPESAFDRARHWLDVEVAGGQHGGIFGYTSPGEPSVAMTAEGMFARLLLGAHRTDRNIEEAARYIHSETTRSGGHLDNFYLLYYGNLALYHYQGWIWDHWNEGVREFLVRSQRTQGTLAGSWDPTDKYMEYGGRVLSTCFATLTLEVYYRYLPLYWKLEPAGGPPAPAPR